MSSSTSPLPTSTAIPATPTNTTTSTTTAALPTSAKPTKPPAAPSTASSTAANTPQPTIGSTSASASSASTPKESTTTPNISETTVTTAPQTQPQPQPSTSSSTTSATTTPAAVTASSTPAPAAPTATVSTPTVTDPETEDIQMAVPTVSHPSAGFVTADVGAPLKAISPVPSATATLPPNLPLLGNMSAEEAQRLGLNHLQNLGAATSYSSPPQAFRPAANTPQPFQAAKLSPATPSPVVKPTDVTPAPSATPTSAAPDSSSTSSQKMAPVVAGMGTLPPNVAAASASGSGSGAAASGSTFSATDGLRAIPTNKNNPAFLNKLRSMVDDPNTDELIRWSPDGASFFVPNHVRFGDEVLPRFFKHNRFSSFVRQLNMYGFHKVPHLQQGALKHDSPQESELWEFSNPHFHRDHPDWLSKVQRKKGPRDEKDTHGEREASASTGQELMHAGALMRTDFGSKGVGIDSGGDGALQLASVLNAINAIKNAQTSISADLRHLQNSNQNLWQEAVESRQRAKRQQETINKILRFLAGVFGNEGDEETPVQGKKVSGKGRGGRKVMRPQQQQRSKSRLMIEEGPSSGSLSTVRGLEGLELPADDDEEIEEMPNHLRFQEHSGGDSPKGQSPSTGNGGSRFTQIGSPPTSSNINSTEFGRQLSEAVSTPGGSRRLSSQASNQVLNALASGEGNAWLASLFGASFANQGGSKTTGPASGGGLKLDPQMVAALQQALASAGGSGAGGAAATNAGDNGADYFGGTGNNVGGEDFSSRFSTFPGGSGTGNSSSSNSSQQQGSASGSGQGLGLDADGLARIAGLSQALVQSPAKQNFNLGNNSNNFGPLSPSKASAASLFDGNDDGSNNQQLALSLSRASRDLQHTSEDVDQVQNSINSLIEGLQTNPNLLSGIQGQQPQQQGVSAGAAAMPWQNAPATDPTNPTSFGSGILGAGGNFGDANGAAPFSAGGNGLPTGTTPPPSSAVTGAQTGSVDSDFDVDSFLSQFVDSSQAPGGGVTSPSANNFVDSGMGESPSFAFSPATTAAFLHGGAAQPSNSGADIFAELTSSSNGGSGTSSTSTTPPRAGSEWNNVAGATKGKKRKPSSSHAVNANGGIEDVEMGSARPVKKSAAGKKA